MFDSDPPRCCACRDALCCAGRSVVAELESDRSSSLPTATGADKQGPATAKLRVMDSLMAALRRCAVAGIGLVSRCAATRCLSPPLLSLLLSPLTAPPQLHSSFSFSLSLQPRGCPGRRLTEEENVCRKIGSRLFLTSSRPLSLHSHTTGCCSIHPPPPPLVSERWILMQGGSRKERKTCLVKKSLSDFPSLAAAVSLHSRTAGCCTRHFTRHLVGKEEDGLQGDTRRRRNVDRKNGAKHSPALTAALSSHAGPVPDRH